MPHTPLPSAQTSWSLQTSEGREMSAQTFDPLWTSEKHRMVVQAFGSLQTFGVYRNSVQTSSFQPSEEHRVFAQTFCSQTS